MKGPGQMVSPKSEKCEYKTEVAARAQQTQFEKPGSKATRRGNVLCIKKLRDEW